MGSNYCDPSVGYCMAVSCMLQSCIAIPTEVSAVGLLAGYWDKEHSHLAAYIAAAIVLVGFVNLIGVRWYGEVCALASNTYGRSSSSLPPSSSSHS